MTRSDAAPKSFVPGDLTSEFRGKRLPVDSHLAGYSAIMLAFDLNVPLHHEMAAVAPRNTRSKEDGWRIFPVSMRPADDAVSHLLFALKHEGVQLLTLKFAFAALDRAELERAARAKPTSGYIRRLCFFYEWLTGRSLNVSDTKAGAYVEAVDTDRPVLSFCCAASNVR